MSIKFDLTGKNCVVTGGASGIGWALVQELQQAGAGKIFVLDTTSITSSNSNVVFVKTDVADEANFKNSLQTCLEQCGHVDLFVNNAGILRESDIKNTIAINLNGTINGSLLALNHMAVDRGGRGGTIVNIASILGLDSGSGCPIYAASKFGVVGFSRNFDEDYCKKTQVRMLIICPGLTSTSLFSDLTALDQHMRGKMKIFENFQKVPQKSEFVAQSIVKVLTEGESGSIWVAEFNEFYQVEMPSYEILPRKKTLT